MPVGTAAPVEGGFRLSGRWKYASGSDHTDWAFLGGTPPGGELEERRIFLVPKSDYEIVDVWHVAGLKATGSQDIVIKDVFVPAYRTVKFSDNLRGWRRAMRSTPRRSTGCRSARCSSAASRPARSARCKACSTPISTTARSASAGCPASRRPKTR